MILDILKQVEESKGSKNKLQVLQFHKDNLVLKELWYFAYARENFHTRKMIPTHIGSESNPKSFGSVVSLLDKLRCKTSSGNAQLALIEETLSNLHPDCIEVFNRVIKGNLRCGLGATVANKVWGKDFIPKYPVMLISPYCPKKAAKIMKGGAVMQLKSDGVRGICEVVNKGGYATHIVVGGELEVANKGGYDYKFFSRQGEEFHGLGEVFEEDIKNVLLTTYQNIGSGINIDGEFTYIDENGKHDPSKASGIMNKAISGSATKEELESLTYLVWDLYVEDDKDIYYDRLEDLSDGLKCSGVKRVKLVDTWPVKTLQEVADKYQEIVDAGNEGVVLKSLGNTWGNTRVTDCIKYKEKHSGSFRIKSWYYGESGKEFQNVLGGFVIESEDGKVTSKTGSGLSFEDRGILAGCLDKKGKPIYLKDEDGNYIKDPDSNYDDYISQILEMEYNKRSKTKEDRDTFSLRFPIVKHFRCDKVVADTLDTLVQEEALSRGLKL